MVYFWPILITFSALVVIGIILWILRKRVKPGEPQIKRMLVLYGNWLFYPSIIGLLLIFLRNQGINLISWRLWLMMLAIVWLAGIIYCLYITVFDFRSKQRELNINKIKSKYMPESKEGRR